MKIIRTYSIILFCFCSLHSFSKSNSILLHPAPIADFQIYHFCFGETTYFINTTQGGVFYTWNIFTVDSNNVNTDTIYTSSIYNAIFLFPNIGKYKIELIADNGHIVSVEKYLYVDSLPNADFDYKSCRSQFNNLSVCYDSCFWDFGDGQTSTLTDPQHYYAVGGNYSVKLIAKNGTKSDTMVHSIFGMSNGIDSTFRMTILRDSLRYCYNDTGALVLSDSIMVLFEANDTITGPYTSYHWSFGDGEVADLYGFNGGRKVYHLYGNLDVIYTVFFLARLPCANAFSSKDLTFFYHLPNINQTVDGLTIFPNPVSENILHITTDRKSELNNITLLNYLSQPVIDSYLIDTSNGFDINVSNLSAGLYFIRLFFGDEIITQKIIRD